MIAIDPDGRVLLLGGRAEGRRVWITPGGGCWPDEDDPTTACREFFEETGFRIDPRDVGRAVGYTSGLWTAEDGTRYRSVDYHFAVRLEAFAPTRDGHEALESAWIEEFRWWPIEDLETTHETVWPLELAGLIRRILAGDWPAEPVRFPWHHDE